jgi:hypothetical protein
MTVSIKIPEDWQYGYVAASVARCGSMQRNAVEYIKRNLFNKPNNTQSQGLGYEQMVVDFTKVMRGFDPKNKSLNGLKQGIISEDDLAAAMRIESASIADPVQVPQSFEALFCIAIEGLCLALAKVSFEEKYPENLDNDDEEIYAELETSAPANTRVEYKQAEFIIASILMRRLPHKTTRVVSADAHNQDAVDEEFTRSDFLHLLSIAMLEALLAAMPTRFTKEMSKPIEGWERYYIVLKDALFAGRIKNFLSKLPFQYTLQPLKQPVQYSVAPPNLDEQDEAKPFRLTLIGYRRTNSFLQRFHFGFIKNGNIAGDFNRYLEAINVQQAVPWRINLALLSWVYQLIDLVINLEDQDNADNEELRTWINEKFYQPTKNIERKRFERPGEFLDHILAQRALEELCQIDENGVQTTFYLPWKADYRGRIYAETPWLSPQGGDIQRALFEFTKGRLLDENGLQALKRHGANLVRRKRILGDLGITGRQVVTLEEREGWINDHEEQILASAESPIEKSFWREVASKPMQFLAFCLAYSQWKEDPQAPIHLPIQIDGTCNGLQHIAALTCDEALARAVNVLPKAEGFPGDIYTELSEAAANTLGKLHEIKGLKLPKEHQSAILMADGWLAGVADGQDWLNRETAKKVVMTIPYGAGPKSQATHVLDAIAYQIEKKWKTDTVATNIEKWINSNDTSEKYPRSSFRSKCCKGHFKELRRSAFAGDSNAKTDWNQLRSLAAYASLAIVYHLRHALSTKYPCVDGFSSWLKEIAKANSGLPLLWTSPLGFPVCQDKFRLQGTSVNAKLSGKTIRLDVRRLKEDVEPVEQASALLPNLIHSLDATHLALILLGAKYQNITDVGSVHDCLLCHPNDAVSLGRIVRSTFAGMYARKNSALPSPLARWDDWMQLVAKLRDLTDLNLIMGALSYPNDIGELLLQQKARQDDELAAKSLIFLDDIRKLDPSLQFLMKSLLQYAIDTQLKPRTKKTKFPTLPAGELMITADSISEYFFS